MPDLIGIKMILAQWKHTLDSHTLMHVIQEAVFKTPPNNSPATTTAMAMR